MHSALPRVQMEDGQAVERALLLFAGGLEFTDALHLASSPAASRFASFDKNLLRKSRRQRTDTRKAVPTLLAEMQSHRVR